jgi:pimeloyl-ACP methyl ester carboxylesterase
MEKLNMWRGKSRAGISIVWSEMLATDLSAKITELKIPVYFIEGIYDYTCSYTEAKSFFEKLKAPVKGFYTFQNSAHSPFFEEPEKMQKILREDILAGYNNSADIK